MPERAGGNGLELPSYQHEKKLDLAHVVATDNNCYSAYTNALIYFLFLLLER